jgi:histidyl-tRNA synthetase
MYTFVDRGGRSITLKPEGTAPSVRAAVEHGLIPQGTVRRFGYVTPIFRYERPQKGRLREAHQVGIELIGSASPAADAEIIEFTVRFYERLGIRRVRVSLNSLGRAECRKSFRSALLEFAEPKLAGYDEQFRAKIRANPLRLLDTKDEELKLALENAPSVLDFLEPESAERFAELQRLLGLAEVDFVVDSGIVRGLDYYTETVFEVQSDALGAQNALCGGGRYDDLVSELGGAPTPSVGVAMGIERALLVIEASGTDWKPQPPDVFVVSAGPESADAAASLARALRAAGIACITDPDCRSMKSQMNQANKSGARFAAIIGEVELKSGTVTLRALSTGEQEAVRLQSVAEHIGGVTQ